MPWLYSNTEYPDEPASYEWRGANTYNQHCAAIGSVPANAAITQLRAYAAGRTSAVSTYLVLWNAGGSVIKYSSVFSMAAGTETGGGQAWQTKSITAIKVDGGTYWVGLYRNPSGGHIFGRPSSPGASAYQKTNTSSFPSLSSMSGYSTDSGDEVTVGLFYITAPDDPTSASVARVSDTRHTISWTRNADSDKPVYNQYVQRYDNVSGAWTTIATITTDYTTNGAQSYTDTTTVANKRYRYRVYANNTSGNSGYAYTDYIRTTPAVPTSVIATRVGTTVEITWNDNATAETNQTIQRKTSTDNVTWGSYSTLSSAIAANTEIYTDSSPANYNKYQVRADCTDPTLNSSYVESDVVIIIQPPSAPTSLIPSDSTAIDADNAYTFSWTHNSLDGTSQSKFSLQYREQGGAWPGTPQYNETASTDNFVEIAGSTFTNGTTYEWQVKTWGQHATAGDWSDTATFVASTTPVIVVTDPTEITNYAYSSLEVDWDYTQPDSSNQVEYICSLYDSSDTLLETVTENTDISNGGSDTAVFTTALTNSTSYKIILLVKSAAGLWSASNEVTFTTSFLEPTTPVITLLENSDIGGVNISIENPAIVVTYNEDSAQDTYVNSTYSAANYNGNGQLDLIDDTGGGTDKSIILLDFDLSEFAGDTIVSAYLYLYRKYALTPGIDSTVNYIKTAFDETTVTYATIPTLDTTDHDDHTHSAGDSETWDISTLVQDICDGDIADYEGIAVVASTTDGSADYFYDSTVVGSEPELIIEISPRNAETVSNKVYRSVASGAWELVDEDIPVNTTITDYLPSVGGNTNYYAQAVSALPSTKNSAEVDIDILHTGYYYLNGGNGYEDYIKLRGDTSISEQFGRETKLKKYHGREYPVKHEGENKYQIITFSCDLPKTDFETIKNIIETAGNHFYRSYEGDYFQCGITNPNKKDKSNAAYQLSLTIERVDNSG